MDIVNVLLRKVRSVEEIFIIKFLMEEYVIGDVCDVDDNNIDVDIDVFGIEDFFLDMLEYMLFIILMQFIFRSSRVKEIFFILFEINVMLKYIISMDGIRNVIENFGVLIVVIKFLIE